MASATAWNAFSGYSGYISLGHAAFFGTGAYVLAIVAERLDIPAGASMFALVPVAGLGAAVVAVPFGLVALRTRRHTFVVITIAVFFTFQLLAFNLSITHGSSGIQVPSPNWAAAHLQQPLLLRELWGSSCLPRWCRGACGGRFSGFSCSPSETTRTGRAGLGVPVGRVKLIAFVISAAPVGMCGAVYAYFLGQIFPQFAFNPLFDLSVALMALFGGIGTLAGPLLGALVLESLQQYFTIQFTNDDLYLVVYGALFLVVLLWMPRGVIPRRRLVMSSAERRRWASSRARPDPAVRRPGRPIPEAGTARPWPAVAS